jgi:hypothetical protein
LDKADNPGRFFHLKTAGLLITVLLKEFRRISAVFLFFARQLYRSKKALFMPYREGFFVYTLGYDA